MSFAKRQSGFSAVELVIVLAVVAVLGLVGYSVNNRLRNKPGSTQNSAAKASDVSAAPEVKSASDLDKASQVLDQNNPGSTNSSDASKLDGELGAF